MNVYSRQHDQVKAGKRSLIFVVLMYYLRLSASMRSLKMKLFFALPGIRSAVKLH